MMKIANVHEALGHVDAWYADHTVAGEQLPTVSVMESMPGYGGWVLRADFNSHVSLVRVGPRGGMTWLITLTDEQITELR